MNSECDMMCEVAKAVIRKKVVKKRRNDTRQRSDDRVSVRLMTGETNIEAPLMNKYTRPTNISSRKQNSQHIARHNIT